MRKKQGVMVIENLFSLILIVIISCGAFFGVNSFKNIYEKHQHDKFKMQFLDFVNFAKYKSISNMSTYVLEFSKDRIVLKDGSNKFIKRFKFPKNIKMFSNNLQNNRIIIRRNGLITRGATFKYFFGNIKGEIVMSTITGKITYD